MDRALKQKSLIAILWVLAVFTVSTVIYGLTGQWFSIDKAKSIITIAALTIMVLAPLVLIGILSIEVKTDRNRFKHKMIEMLVIILPMLIVLGTAQLVDAKTHQSINQNKEYVRGIAK